MPHKVLVLATRNQGKVMEFRDLLSAFDIRIKGLDDFDPIPSVAEDGETFEENARKKAVHTAKTLGLASLADDSGLVVEALGGEPGVRSARYAGEKATDEANNRKLLKAMGDISDRRAAFECVIAIAIPQGTARIYKGRCDGEIVKFPKGEKGFGYDPVFYYSPLGKTFAEMSPEEKNSVSHRGRAMAQIRNEFDRVLLWLEQGYTR